MYKILAFLVLTLTACAGMPTSELDLGVDAASPDNYDGSTTGARIVVPSFQVGGATLYRPTFYDRQLGTLCQPSRTTAGLRCVPEAISLILFSDAACTQPAMYTTPCNPAAYGTILASAACNPDVRVYRLRKLTQTNYYSKFSATCTATPLSPGYDLYAADTEIDPATFAEAVEVR